MSNRTIGGLVHAVAVAAALFWGFGTNNDNGLNGGLQRPEGDTGAMPAVPGGSDATPSTGAIPPFANLEVAIQRAAAKVNAKPRPPLETRTSWEGMSPAEAAVAFAVAASAANAEASLVSPFGSPEPEKQKEPAPR